MAGWWSDKWAVSRCGIRGQGAAGHAGCGVLLPDGAAGAGRAVRQAPSQVRMAPVPNVVAMLDCSSNMPLQAAVECMNIGNLTPGTLHTDAAANNMLGPA